MNHISSMLSVYFIAGTQDCYHLEGAPQDNLLFILKKALEAGISCFQLREKGNKSLQKIEQILPLARACQDLCRAYHVPFFINDDVELALKINAEGIHIGQDDMNIQSVILQCQGKLLIGLSINSLAQAIQAQHIDSIDYFGVGPIFKTLSKADAKREVGVNLLINIREQGITTPIVAIGGITESQAKSVLSSGADGVAVISAITHSQQIHQTIQLLKGK